MIKKILLVLVFVLFIAWLLVIVLDYNSVRKNQSPKFCIRKETREIANGTVSECLGLGYKSYIYNLTTGKEMSFGPFWIKQKYQ